MRRQILQKDQMKEKYMLTVDCEIDYIGSKKQITKRIKEHPKISFKIYKVEEIK